MSVKGSALLGVLWLSCALGLLSVSWLRQAHLAQRTSKQMSDRLNARVAAHGIIHYVTRRASGDAFSLMKNRTGRLSWSSGNRLDWSIEDEQARIPFALALEGALDHIGPRRRAAERSYRQSGWPAEVMLEEFLNDWPTATRSRVASLVTVYGSGTVNVLMASELVLVAMGMPQRLAEKLVTWRNGVDGEVGTADDQRLNRALKYTTSPAGWSMQQWQDLHQQLRRPVMSVHTSCYRVTLSWRSAMSNAEHRMTAWVQHNPQHEWSLVHWQEEPW